MTAGEACQRQLLAHLPGYRVELCSCGAVHVHAGPVTVRMTREDYETFATVVATAMANLAQQSERPKRPALRLVDDERERRAP